MIAGAIYNIGVYQHIVGISINVIIGISQHIIDISQVIG